MVKLKNQMSKPEQCYCVNKRFVVIVYRSCSPHHFNCFQNGLWFITGESTSCKELLDYRKVAITYGLLNYLNVIMMSRVEKTKFVKVHRQTEFRFRQLDRSKCHLNCPMFLSVIAGRNFLLLSEAIFKALDVSLYRVFERVCWRT